jgi:cytochrome oxidase Cu insertion factor (SCO1/SenC/PrrC family)/thiol-disulfide isomerase/thioredoxin
MSSTRRFDPVLAVVWGGACLAVAVAVALAVLAFLPSGSTSSPAGPGDTGLSSADTDLLAAEPMTPTEAPGFTLTDQHGRRSRLADFRGRAVVLSFNDDRCTDICTLLAQDVVAANRDLGADRRHVAFVSVNVNPYFPTVADIRRWADAHGLGHVANWTSETGSPASLTDVEHAYDELVKTAPATRTIEHGTDLVFIDPSGRERLIGMYGTESADTAAFGHALADAAESTLPPGQRHGVTGAPATGGPTVPSGTPIRVPGLGGAGPVRVGDAHRFTVITFFSSTCTVCATELPGIEHEYRKTHGSADFVGVDVADQAAAARALIARTGVTYPVGADPTGATAARFGVTGLPYTVIVDPSGRVVTTHPGLLTADQLDYLLSVLPGSA